MKPTGRLCRGAGIGVALWSLAALAFAEPSACRRHGGVADCDRNGRPVCKDGTLDVRFACKAVPLRRKVKRVLKFKKPPNRGQILMPGEHPPEETLEQSQKEMSR